jgi:hypothetical protein
MYTLFEKYYKTENYVLIYGIVNRYTRGHSVVMVWIHKLISNKIEHYKFWKERIIETILHIHRGHLTILGVLAPTEGREELSEDCYER